MKEKEKRKRQELVSREASRRDVFIVPRFEAVRHFRWARLAAISSSRESIVEFVLQSRRLVYRWYTSCTVREIEDLVPRGPGFRPVGERECIERPAPVSFSRFLTGICTCKDRAKQIAAWRACRSVYRAVYLRAAWLVDARSPDNRDNIETPIMKYDKPGIEFVYDGPSWIKELLA